MKDFFNLPIIVVIFTTVIQMVVQIINERSKTEKNEELKRLSVYAGTIILLENTQEKILDIQNEMFETFTALSKCFFDGKEYEDMFYSIINEGENQITELETLKYRLKIRKSFFKKGGISYNHINSFIENIDTVIFEYIDIIDAYIETQKTFREQLSIEETSEVLTLFNNHSRDICYHFAETMSNLNTMRLNLSERAFDHFNVIKFS